MVGCLQCILWEGGGWFLFTHCLLIAPSLLKWCWELCSASGGGGGAGGQMADRELLSKVWVEGTYVCGSVVSGTFAHIYILHITLTAHCEVCPNSNCFTSTISCAVVTEIWSSEMRFFKCSEPFANSKRSDWLLSGKSVFNENKVCTSNRLATAHCPRALSGFCLGHAELAPQVSLGLQSPAAGEDPSLVHVRPHFVSLRETVPIWILLSLLERQTSMELKVGFLKVHIEMENALAMDHNCILSSAVQNLGQGILW